jgi:hypothetical protein
MSFKNSAVVLAMVTAISAPAAAWAWGVPGCANLPEYNRAVGALQGMTSACSMTVEEARRVVAAHDGPAAVQQNAPEAEARSHHQRLPYNRAAHSRRDAAR